MQLIVLSKKQRQQALCRDGETKTWRACDQLFVMCESNTTGKKNPKQNRAIKAFRTLVWKSSQRFFLFFFTNTNIISVSFGALIHLLKKRKRKKKVFYVLTTKHCIVSGCIREELQATIIKKPPKALSTQHTDPVRVKQGTSCFLLSENSHPPPPKEQLQWINHLNSQG